MVTAGRRCGIETADASALSLGVSATVLLPRAALVARVGQPGAEAGALAAELAFARWARAHGISAVSPAEDAAPEPVYTDGGYVAFWTLLTAVPGAHVDPDWLGATLRRLHALDVPAGLGDSWDPLARVRGRIDRYERMTGYSQAHATTLRRLSDRIERELEGLRRSRAVGLVHGDPSPGNVVVTAAGPVLIDFDLAGAAPVTWDLTVAVVQVRRFGQPADGITRLIRAYGRDPRDEAGFPLLIRLRELLDTSYAMEQSHSSAVARAELDRRMRAWRDPGDRTRWTPCRAPGS